MTRRFDPKQFSGKPRVYVPVAGAEGVLRLYSWDEVRKEYRPPAGAKSYLARRWEIEGCRRLRRSKYFDSLADARAWRARLSGRPESPNDVSGPGFSDVVTEWKGRRYPSMAATTQVAYDKLLRLYFGPLLELPIRAISPQVIDRWIDGLIAGRDRYGRGETRKAFKHELSLLSGILRYYAEYTDDPEFVMPLKQRHRDAVRLRNRSAPARKDLSEAAFRTFLAELGRGRDGGQLVALATTQFYQALRISEVAALHWDDVHFDFADPCRSRLTFTRHVAYARSKTVEDRIETGSKNSDGMVGGVKEHPMLPEVFACLSRLYRPGSTGLVFTFPATGGFWPYRALQSRFDRAFKRAGLPYRGTHVMRHGGTRKTFDETRGDIGVAQQILGNRSRQTVDVYAQRASSAFTRYAETQWERVEASGGGRTWSQNAVRLELVQEKRED